MNTHLANKFKKELEGCVIHDNYIMNSSIDNKPIEYLIISIGNHHYAISYRIWYVMSEIEEPTREAIGISEPLAFSGNRLKEYIKQLKIKNIVN